MQNKMCSYCSKEIKSYKTKSHFNLPHNTPLLQLNYNNETGDYIDFIRSNEVVHSVMHGTDKYNRPFIVLKVNVYDANNNLKDTRIETFFQRYTDNQYLWMGCGHATNLFISTIGGMSSCQFELITDLIAGNTVIVKECHCPDFNINVGDKICLQT